MAKKKYGIIGHPVTHSLSPAMHNAAFKSLGIDAVYDLYDVRPEELNGFMDTAKGEGILGFNVTIPHKIAAKEYLEHAGTLNENAGRLGAVNTVKVSSGGLSGYNTDGPGFYRSLVEDLKFEPEGKTVFILGAGGAASAVLMYLGDGPRKILISDIDTKKAEDLKDHYVKYYDPKRLEIISHEKLGDSAPGCDLLVNATPIGMKESDPLPLDEKLLKAPMRVYDLVYNRPLTGLVKAARRSKLHAVTGLGMLLYQGAIAFEIWTGMQAPVDVMRRALNDALKAQG